jgi:hypothetical protein
LILKQAAAVSWTRIALDSQAPKSFQRFVLGGSVYYELGQSKKRSNINRIIPMSADPLNFQQHILAGQKSARHKEDDEARLNWQAAIKPGLMGITAIRQRICWKVAHRSWSRRN